MDDLISRQAAIDALAEELYHDVEDYRTAVSVVGKLPSAQPETHKERTETHSCDLISRQWLMECVEEGWIKFDTEKDENRFIHLVRDITPSAQPDRELIEQLKWERDTAIQQLKDLGYGLGEKPKTDDTISRQAAIDALKTCQTYLFDTRDPDEKISLESAVYELEALPSAHPELNEWCHDCKEYDTENDCCPRWGQVIKTALEDAQPERWIPCSERLPETNGRYIVTRGLKACNAIWNRVYIINYSDLMGLKAEKIWWDGNVGKSDFQKIDDVIAWMPLPEPYKGEQE